MSDFKGTLKIIGFVAWTFVVQTETSFNAMFRNPPTGYGEVPFWWWSGEKLDKDRFLWQIEELYKAGIAGIQVNYSHLSGEGWKTVSSAPEIFTDAWWTSFRSLPSNVRSVILEWGFRAIRSIGQVATISTASSGCDFCWYGTSLLVSWGTL